MSDQNIFDDEELSALVKRTIAEEMQKRAKAEQQPKDFFDQRAADWLDPSIEDPEEEEPETFEDQIERWNEEDREPELNAFGAAIGTPDELWDQARGPDKLIEDAQPIITDIFQRWLNENSDE